MKNKILIALFIVLIFLISIFMYNTIKKEKKDTMEVIASSESELDLELEKTSNKSNTNKLIKVDIKGAVKKPGVYEVSEELRVNDIINLSGGLIKGANTNYINLSAKVKDEMVIWIYTTEEINELKLRESSTQYMIKECNCPVVDNTTCLNKVEKEVTNDNSVININTATLDELMTLTGVGESKAKSIIEYRTNNGKFVNKEDIMNVSGIGESAYTKIKDNITV